MIASKDLERHCGPPAVAALFARRPQDVMRLFHTSERRRLAGPYCAVLARLRRPYREVPPLELTRIAGTPHHGGIVALALPRPIPALDPLAPPRALFHSPVTPVLDGVSNPHNLGAIARSAAFLGCRALVLSADPRQAGLSEAAFRTSAGGLEALEIFRAQELAPAMRLLGHRFTTIAALAHGGVSPTAVHFQGPVLLVLGNEETGVAAATAAACRWRVTLPAAGPIESLNVAVAAALLIEAFRHHWPRRAGRFPSGAEQQG